MLNVLVYESKHAASKKVSIFPGMKKTTITKEMAKSRSMLSLIGVKL